LIIAQWISSLATLGAQGLNATCGCNELMLLILVQVRQFEISIKQWNCYWHNFRPWLHCSRSNSEFQRNPSHSCLLHNTWFYSAFHCLHHGHTALGHEHRHKRVWALHSEQNVKSHGNHEIFSTTKLSAPKIQTLAKLCSTWFLVITTLLTLDPQVSLKSFIFMFWAQTLDAPGISLPTPREHSGCAWPSQTRWDDSQCAKLYGYSGIFSTTRFSTPKIQTHTKIVFYLIFGPHNSLDAQTPSFSRILYIYGLCPKLHGYTEFGHDHHVRTPLTEQSVESHGYSGNLNIVQNPTVTVGFGSCASLIRWRGNSLP